MAPAWHARHPRMAHLLSHAAPRPWAMHAWRQVRQTPSTHARGMCARRQVWATDARRQLGPARLAPHAPAQRGVGKLDAQQDARVNPVLDGKLNDDGQPDHDGHGAPHCGGWGAAHMRGLLPTGSWEGPQERARRGHVLRGWLGQDGGCWARVGSHPEHRFTVLLRHCCTVGSSKQQAGMQTGAALPQA